MVSKPLTYSRVWGVVVVGASALVAGVPSSDSPDFFLDTTLIPSDLSFAESADFAMDTFIAFRTPQSTNSPEFGLDLGGVNRVWGDSESFALDVPPQTGTLAVLPSSDFESAGNQWGPFVPGSKTYTLRNVGEEPISWTASTLEPWITLSPSSETLSAGGVAYVTVSIDQINARFLLMPGTYVDWVFFTNQTNGSGSTTREIVLTVLAVQPAPDEDLQHGNTVTLDHLWEWSENDGQFVNPPNNTVTIDPTQPTYLLTHGWDGSLNGTSCTDPAYAMSSIGCAIREKNPDVNLLAWDWQHAANPNGLCDFPDVFLGDLGQAVIDAMFKALSRGPQAALVGLAGDVGIVVGKILIDARRSAAHAGDEGNKLATALARILDQPNGSLGSELHLIGKSHGGGVMGVVAKKLAQADPPHPVASLTTLDTPKVGCLRILGCFINSLKNVDPSLMPETATGVFYYRERLGGGFGAGIARGYGNLTNLKLNPDLVPNFDIWDPLNPQWIDHLWISGLDSGLCPAQDGWYPTGLRTAGVPVFDNTTPATSLLDVPAYPSGCFVEGDEQFHFSSSACSAVAGLGDENTTDTAGMSLLRYEPFNSGAAWSGNLTQLEIGTDSADATNRWILMQEQGDASFFKDIDWPAAAEVITFDYMFREPRGKENLTVYVADQIVYYDNAQTTLARDHLTSSGAIYVGDVPGTTARLNFVFRSDVPDGGTPDGALLIDNVRVYGLLPGDSDLDGDRDLADFAGMQRCYGRGLTPDDPLPDECWTFDVNGDSTVGDADYQGDLSVTPQFTGFWTLIDSATTGGPMVPPIP